ncbi:peptidylprolyl isomerase [Chitinophaga cymbidii]|nr:peptidylprolyl isomerase [Chitinophaga cymbidii]
MSVIQKIRDKYAVVIIVLICLAIVSFLLQDVFFGRNSMFNQSTKVGKVNGEELDYREYQQRIENMQERMRQQMPGASLDDQTQQYIREQAWDQFLREKIMQAQYEELGIEVTQAEVTDQIYGKNPHPLVLQYFADPQTGQFDRSVLQRVAEQVKQDPTGQMSQQLLAFDQMITEYQKNQKYITLVHQGIYYPKWLAQMEQQSTAENANISYVQVPYASIADSTIKVTDAELNKYIQDHKALFEVKENRRVEYVAFNALASAADSALALTEFEKLKAELDTTPDVAGFIKLNSELPYYDGYAPRNSIQVPAKDSIIDLPAGKIYGPYQDNNLLVYAKVIDRKTLPDTVKIRQILVAIQPGLSDSLAKKRADSLESVIRGGGDFAALAATFSDDPNSKQNGGEYTLTPNGYFANELQAVKDFAFEGNSGALKVVKMPIGYAVVKITEQKNFGPALKIAYLAKRVDASSTTSSEALALANDFASKNRDWKTFEKTVQEQGLDKRQQNLGAMDFVIPGLGSSREIVSWAYKADKGEISPVFTLEDKFVVAVLTSAREAGTAPLEEVRPQVEAEVKKNKKADQIIAKMKSPATIEAAASATNQPVLTVDAISFATPFIPSLGFEPRVSGAAFNKAWGTAKATAPIQGNGGVYVLKVNTYVPSGQSPLDYEQQRTAYEQNLRQLTDNQLFEALKKKSDVKDDRASFFTAN